MEVRDILGEIQPKLWYASILIVLGINSFEFDFQVFKSNYKFSCKTLIEEGSVYNCNDFDLK